MRHVGTFLKVALIGLALLLAPVTAEAKGCIKGAIVGAIAGHYAVHHGILGAAAGCYVGRHEANRRKSMPSAAAPSKSAPPSISTTKSAQSPR